MLMSRYKYFDDYNKSLNSDKQSKIHDGDTRNIHGVLYF